jgi:uncharacterized protein YjbJ (UPF0337 family)
MGELKDKAKGLANEAAGNLKQAAGKARNDPAQTAEGKAQNRRVAVNILVSKGLDGL